MKKIIILSLSIIFISCEKTNPLDLDITHPNTVSLLDSTINYEFESFESEIRSPNET